MSEEQRPLLGPTARSCFRRVDWPTSPFVAQLVNKIGITGGDGSKIGYYAGMIEYVFLLTESVFTLQYGRISDRIGRRPVLMFGSFGQAISISLVVISKQFWQLVFSRSLSGALNGNIGVMKSMVVELTDETNQAQGKCSPFCGTLSHPEKLLPGVFDTPFWNQYPYFLPCLIAAIYSSCVFPVGGLFLKETHAVPSEHSRARDTAECGAVSVCPPQPRRSASVRSVLTKRAGIAITNYAFLAFSDITYLGLLPIVLAVSVQDGGLGFSPRTIELILGLQGIVTGLFQVFFFAPLHHRLGNKRLYAIGYLFYPLIRDEAGDLDRPGSSHRTFVPGLYDFHSAPSKASLGTLNGVSQTIISITRAIGPATATSLFSLSIRKNILGGNFVYAILLGMSCAGVYASRWLKEERRAYQ
ncbi:major facilitator superfamily domain-containing protein [Rhizoctonia solani]|nr:major facilitator superfamily domain-containing protein [Rhizoctonia solani]